MYYRLIICLCVFVSVNCKIVPCQEYNAYTQNNYRVGYYAYYYSCGWWGWSRCRATASYQQAYTTYYQQLDCCLGHGPNDVCIPICSTACGTNKECTSPETCTCVEGWEGSDCLTDIDECERETDVCEYRETCSNTAGSYDCACPNPRDKLAADGRRCISQVEDLRWKSDRRNLTLFWEHPVNLTDDGTFDHYLIECHADRNISYYGVTSTSDQAGWVKNFTVGPVSPWINYTCGVAVVTSDNGMGSANTVRVLTKQDRPDDPPRDIKVLTIDSKILLIQWKPPAIPNGIVEYHRLYIDYTNTTRIYRIEVEPAYNLFFLEFLYPHQTVGISITATTGGGEGPQTGFSYNTTAQTEPGRVSDMNVTILSDISAQVTWTPPKALNGIVISYHIFLYQITASGTKTTIETWDLDADDELKHKFFSLSPFVPYEFVVTAATHVGQGEIAPFKFYTRQDVPKAAPVTTSSTRATPEQIYVSWDSVSDTDLQGYFVDYVIKYYTTAVHSDCSSPKDELTETTTDNFIWLKDLEPHEAYCVKIAASTSEGTGVYSDYIFIDEITSSKFELQLNGIHDCEFYVHDNENNDEKLSDIGKDIVDAINRYCKCGIRYTYISEGRLFCTKKDNDRVIFQASILSTSGSDSDRLVEYIEEWKNTAPKLVVLGVQVYVNTSCPVKIDNFGASKCEPPTSELQISEESDLDTSGIVGGVIGTVLASVVIIIIVLVIVIAVVIVVRSSGRKSANEVKFVNSMSAGGDEGRVGVSNPIGGDIDEKQLLENMD